MTYSKDQLKKLTGGGSVRTSYKVPTIKFNGNTGILTRFPAGDYKNGEVITDVELVMMRPRRTFTSYEKSPNGIATRMFTNEHNHFSDKITVFEATDGQKVKVIAEGFIEDIRKEVPQLRITTNFYSLYEGEVHKVVIKGKGRQALVDKQKELAKDGVEFFEKKIKLSSSQESGTGGNIFYYLNYQVVGDSDLNVVGPHMEKMAEIFDRMDNEYTEGNKRRAEAAGEDSGEDMLPIDNIKKESEDEINVEDIPF